MIDYIHISPDKKPEENIRIIKGYLDDLADNLNLLQEAVEKLKKESEGK